jgi:hypothetical protein
VERHPYAQYIEQWKQAHRNGGEEYKAHLKRLGQRHYKENREDLLRKRRFRMNPTGRKRGRPRKVAA